MCFFSVSRREEAVFPAASSRLTALECKPLENTGLSRCVYPRIPTAWSRCKGGTQAMSSERGGATREEVVAGF